MWGWYVADFSMKFQLGKKKIPNKIEQISQAFHTELFPKRVGIELKVAFDDSNWMLLLGITSTRQEPTPAWAQDIERGLSQTS